MSQQESNLDELREEFRSIKRNIEGRLALDAYNQLTGAIPIFELAIQLGKGNSEDAQKLITEIRKYLIQNQHRLAKQLQRYSYKESNKKYCSH